MTRWFRATDEEQARNLFALCHPTVAPRPAHWFHVFPTLVIPEATYLVGMTSFTLTAVRRGWVAYGWDLCVNPKHRGQGLGTLLHRERCRVAQELGAVDFVVTTTPDNERMIAIAEHAGYERHGSDDTHVFYIGRIR